MNIRNNLSSELFEFHLGNSHSSSCEQSKQQKHVTFAPFHVIHNKPSQEKSNQISISSIQPVSILKETNYKYSKYQQWYKKFNDILYLLLIIAFLTFFEKSLKFFS